MSYDDFKQNLVNEIRNELGSTFKVITFTAAFKGEKLDALCAKTGESMASIIRRALIKLLESDNNG